MTTHTNTASLPHNEPYYISPDSLIGLIIRDRTAKELPQSDLGAVHICMRLKKGTRVQSRREDDFDADLLLTNREIQEFHHGLQQVDPESVKALIETGHPIARTLPHDVTYYVSPDSQVSFIIRNRTAKKSPQHDFGVVCICMRVKAGTRVQPCPVVGFDYEISLTNREIEEFFFGLQQANPDHVKTLIGTAQDKDPARKQRWFNINKNRFKRG